MTTTYSPNPQWYPVAGPDGNPVGPRPGPALRQTTTPPYGTHCAAPGRSTAATIDPWTGARLKAARPRPSLGYAVVGVIGEVMITMGVLLGLFVVWQLVWTTVVADQAQNELVEQMQQAPGWEKAVANTDAPQHTDDPPIIDKPADKSQFGTLHVPRFGRNYAKPINEGIDKKTILDVLGIGHYPKTQLPGELGNFAMAGHRTTYGQPFADIADLKNGDYIIVETAKTWYVYKMTSKQIVTPDKIEVTWPVPGEAGAEPTKRLLTMTACHPKFSAAERYIVHAEMEYWMDKSEGTPPELNQIPS